MSAFNQLSRSVVGSRVLITGAASGMGRATARVFATGEIRPDGMRIKTVANENIIMNYRDRILRDPQICGGEPVLKARESRYGQCWQAWPTAMRLRSFSKIFRR